MEREVKKPPKKSLAKAAGLKSTFVISPQEKELAMTAFGRGNDALLQKRIVDGVVRDVAGEKQQFQVQRQDESRFRLQNSRLADRTVTARRRPAASHWAQVWISCAARQYWSRNTSAGRLTTTSTSN